MSQCPLGTRLCYVTTTSTVCLWQAPVYPLWRAPNTSHVNRPPLCTFQIKVTQCARTTFPTNPGAFKDASQPRPRPFPACVSLYNTSITMITPPSLRRPLMRLPPSRSGPPWRAYELALSCRRMSYVTQTGIGSKIPDAGKLRPNVVFSRNRISISTYTDREFASRGHDSWA